MAILGKLVDKQTISVAGGASYGFQLKTYSHSLPATNPELLLPQVYSIQAVAVNGSNGLPRVLGQGGNASILTVGVVMASAVSVPTVAFHLHAIIFHSQLR